MERKLRKRIKTEFASIIPGDNFVTLFRIMCARRKRIDLFCFA